MLMENILHFRVLSKDGSAHDESVNVKRVLIGLICGRDPEKVLAHLQSEKSKGYSVPEAASFCKKSRYLLTNENLIEVQGSHTAGEVECVAIVNQGKILISVGSDHLDRTMLRMWTPLLGKVYDSPKSVQMVPAVVAREAWMYEEISDHRDQLNLRSYIMLEGAKLAYQDFQLSAVVDLEYHFAVKPWLKEDGTVLFLGTSNVLPSVPSNVYGAYRSEEAEGDVIFPQNLHLEIHDPILNRTIRHSYETLSLGETR